MYIKFNQLRLQKCHKRRVEWTNKD